MYSNIHHRIYLTVCTLTHLNLSTLLHSAQSCLNTHWSASLWANIASSESQVSSSMLLAGGWRVPGDIYNKIHDTEISNSYCSIPLHIKMAEHN